MRSSPFIFVIGTAVVSAFTQPTAAQNQDLLARGTYLINGPAACGNCHTDRGPDLLSLTTPNKYLAGGQKFTSPFFITYARNITPDKDTGIGTWTDAQIIRAFREGVAKEGNTLGPPMPIEIYNKMSDDDAKAIVAYLHTVKPIHNEVQEPKYKIPLHPEPPAKGIAAPPKSDKVAYGGYIVNAIAHCLECHTPQVGPKRDYEHQAGAGGFRFEFAGAIVYSRNITPDKETGIGDWSDDQIKRAITEGIDKNGKQLIPLMPYPYFKNMTAEDVNAVVAYLHTLRPVSKKNEVNPTLQSLVKK
jgi:mono/diheme cytochrome c family protein